MPCGLRAERKAQSRRAALVYPKLEIEIAQARELPFFNLCELVWSTASEACAKSNYRFRFDHDVEAFVFLLPEPWRVAYAVHELEGYVLGGGFTSFFDTHSKVLHQDALKGFKAIGASKHLEIVRKALKLRDDEEALGELDSLFFDCSKDDPRKLLAAYILEHFTAFREPRQSRLTRFWRQLKLQALRLTGRF